MSGFLSPIGPGRSLAFPVPKASHPPKFALLLALLSLLAPLRAHAQGKNTDTKAKDYPKVTVLPFVPPRNYWVGNYYWYQSGSDMALRVEDKLLSHKPSVPIVERQYMKDLDQEKLLGSIGSVRDAAQLGQGSGAKLMVIGSIEELSHSEQTVIVVKKVILRAKIKARLVDIRTTEFPQTSRISKAKMTRASASM